MEKLVINFLKNINLKRNKKRWQNVTKWNIPIRGIMEHKLIYTGEAIETIDTIIYNDLRKILKKLNIMEEKLK